MEYAKPIAIIDHKGDSLVKYITENQTGRDNTVTT